MNKTPRILVLLFAAVAALTASTSAASAFDFVFSRGPFSIELPRRHASPPGPVVVPVAPPAFHHPTASLYYDLYSSSGAVENKSPGAPLVAPSPKTVVYGPEYRTAPYLAAPPQPVVIDKLRPAPKQIVVSPAPASSPWVGPFPVRPNNFQPNHYFGPGPHVPGPNHFGGMTPLGPGPRPSFGPH
jgi:hypothetical protein